MASRQVCGLVADRLGATGDNLGLSRLPSTAATFATMVSSAAVRIVSTSHYPVTKTSTFGASILVVQTTRPTIRTSSGHGMSSHSGLSQTSIH